MRLVIRFVAVFGIIIAGASTALAVDGVVLIDQTRALAGNVTPGDAPGFPVTLSRAGSYRLSGNLTVPDENTTAVLVTVNDVSLDLNGFAILGPTVCGGVPLVCAPTGSGDGVRANEGANGTTVMNGTVRGFGSEGIHLGNNARVEKVRAISNVRNGIDVLDGGVIEGSQALRNGFTGIKASGRPTLVRGNTSENNGASGISVNSTSNVSGNIVRSNAGTGIDAGGGSAIITGNTSSDNGGVGLSVGFGSAYSNNVFRNNDVAPVSGSGVSLGQNLCDGVIC